jgi:hypothetical protein
MKTIEISDELYEQIQFLKQALPDEEWNPIWDESKVLELIVWSFLEFIQEQAKTESHWEEGHSCDNC